MVKLFEAILAIVIGLAIYAILAATPVMWLWNWLAPDLFSLQAINFWQALGLLVLCGALFKSGSSSSK
jgi:hypothetical protein